MVKIILPKDSRTYRIHPRVPKRYRAVVGATHVTRSLRTRDLAEAKRQVHPTMAKLQAEWEGMLKAAQADAIRELEAPRITSADKRLHFDGVAHACAYFYEQQRAVMQFLDRSTFEEAKADPGRFWRGDILPVPDDLDPERVSLAAAVVAARRAGLGSERTAIANMLVLRELGALERIAYNVFSPPHCHEREFLIALGRTWLGLLDAVLADETAAFDYLDEVNGRWVRRRDGGEFPLAGAFEAMPGEDQPAAADTPLLSVFLKGYIKERGKSLSAERADVLRACVRDLIEVCGDMPMAAYTKNVASKFKSTLLLLPPNLSKRKQFHGMPLAEVAASAEEQNLPRQSPKNLTKKWAALGSIFTHAHETLDGVSNPFRSKSLAVEDPRAESDQCDPFSDDELRTLLSSKLPAPLYWLVWLGLCTGARPNELLQLHGRHVRRHGDVTFLHFSPELRLKTRRKRSSVRSVPIHASLLQRGFVEFATAAGDGPLFPNMTVHKHGRMSDATGKKFTHYLKKIGLKRIRLSFRSLRHNFHLCWDRANQTAPEARERLMGHHVPGVAGRYGAGYAGEALDMEVLKVRAELLAAVRFVPFDEQQPNAEVAA